MYIQVYYTMVQAQRCDPEVHFFRVNLNSGAILYITAPTDRPYAEAEVLPYA